MAKLSARGRTELVRMEKDGSHDGAKFRVALMSDGSVLSQLSWVQENGRRHTDTWKKRRTHTKEEMNIPGFVDACITSWEKMGYRRV